jgi:hypothetical protein
MDPLGINKAVETALPEIEEGTQAIINAFFDRFEKLLERLDGATITITLAKKG